MATIQAEQLADASDPAREEHEPATSVVELREGPVPLAQVVRLVVAAASLGASAVHASASSEHSFSVWHLLTFLVMAGFQAGWAYLVLRSTRPRVLLMGAVGHGAILLLWLLTRLSGLPEWLPGPGGRESAGFKDIAAAVLAVVVLIGIDVLSRRDVAARAVRSSHAGAALGILVTGTVLLAAAGSFAVGHEHGVTDHTVADAHDH